MASTPRAQHQDPVSPTALRRRRGGARGALCALAATVPLLAHAASDQPPAMDLVESQPPPVQGDLSLHLVDTVIPAYTVHRLRPYRKISDAEDLYNDIRAFAADLDARVMAGSLARPSLEYVPATDEQGQPIPGAKPVLKEREPLEAEVRLVDLLQRLSELRQEIPFPNHFEQWHIDNAQRDLVRSAELLRLGLGDDRYVQLDRLHEAWMHHYLDLLVKAQHEHALALMQEQPKLDPQRALEQARQAVTEVPYPPMSLDGTYAAVEIPQVLPPGRAEQAREQREEVAERQDEELETPVDEVVEEQVEEAAEEAQISDEVAEELPPEELPPDELPPEDAPPVEDVVDEAEQAQEEPVVEDPVTVPPSAESATQKQVEDVPVPPEEGVLPPTEEIEEVEEAAEVDEEVEPQAEAVISEPEPPVGDPEPVLEDEPAEEAVEEAPPAEQEAVEEEPAEEEAAEEEAAEEEAAEEPAEEEAAEEEAVIDWSQL